MALGARDLQVVEASSGEEGLALAAARQVEVVLLDLGLPGMDGLKTLTELRRFSEVPVIVLTARDQQHDKVSALDAGADDYVTKPYGMAELLARLRAALRRALPTTEPVLRVGESEVDLEKRSVTVAGKRVQLTPNEFDLISLFARNEGKLLTHRTILREVWGPAYGEESHYLHVYVSQLRRKLEPDPTRPRYLLTEPGAGYRLVDPPAREA
jgi:two-component system KDP operon response regulator KdpE